MATMAINTVTSCYGNAKKTFYTQHKLEYHLSLPYTTTIYVVYSSNDFFTYILVPYEAGARSILLIHSPANTELQIADC